ncbi:MAG: chloride channel protein [Verrucomicrobiota bacterium]
MRAFPNWLRLRFNDAQRYLILCGIAGLICGLVAVGFHFAIEWVFHGVLALRENFGEGTAFLVLLFSPAIGGLFAGIIVTYIAPQAVGSGIPQVKQAYHNDFGTIRLRDGVWRFIAGTISIGSGNSLGREGPTVHICSAVASALGRYFGLARRRIQAMVPVGMGAGIAAAFNTPISAITFVFEELLGDFSSKALGAILVAVVVSAVVSRTLLGEHPIFNVGGLDDFQLSWWMLMCIPLGIAAAFLGHAFLEILLRVRGRMRDAKRFPRILRPVCGGLIVGIIGSTILILTGRLGVFSIGYEDLEGSLQGILTWEILLLLFFGKLVATALCYAMGGSGGLFAPTLFLGVMLGGAFGTGAVEVFNLEFYVAAGCAFLGMGAFFAAVIRCPLTSILIVFEMTQNYSLILPLMVGNLIAYLISTRLRAVPIYDALLIQDQVSLKRMPSYQGEQDWRNLPVSTIMTHDPVFLRNADALQSAYQEAGEHQHHAYPVLGEAEELVGVITHHEIGEALDHGEERTISDLLKEKRIVSVFPDHSIRDVANTLVVEDVMQVPVVSRKNPTKLLGIVTLHDVARQQNAIDNSLAR